MRVAVWISCIDTLERVYYVLNVHLTLSIGSRTATTPQIWRIVMIFIRFLICISIETSIEETLSSSAWTCASTSQREFNCRLREVYTNVSVLLNSIQVLTCSKEITVNHQASWLSFSDFPSFYFRCIMICVLRFTCENTIESIHWTEIAFNCYFAAIFPPNTQGLPVTTQCTHAIIRYGRYVTVFSWFTSLSR